MKLLVSDLAQLSIEKLIINSVEMAMYQAFVIIDGVEVAVWESDKKVLMRRNLMELRELFQSFDIAQTVLRHDSPYDEMIGMPLNAQGNRLEVVLDKNPYALPSWLH